MSGGTIVGLTLALLSALALNVGFWTQHHAAAGIPPLSLRRPVRSLRLLVTDLRWALGSIVGLGGWALYITALGFAPLSLVQAVSAGGVGVLALLAWRFGATRPTRRELVALGLALGGLVMLAISLSSGSPHGHGGALVPLLLWVACSVAVAGLTVATGTRALRAGAGLGVAAGLLYAAGDVVTKAAFGGGGRLGLIPLLLACHGLAFISLQLGFQRGDVLATAGLSSLFTNAVPIAAGIVLFGEGLPGGWAGSARIVAFAAVVVGGAALARGDRADDDRQPAVPALTTAAAVPVSPLR